VPDNERVALTKEIWKLILDEVWGICLVANSQLPGVRVVKTTWEHRQRQWNSAVSENPMIAHRRLLLQVVV